jgi:hypothetical protein
MPQRNMINQRLLFEEIHHRAMKLQKLAKNKLKQAEEGSFNIVKINFEISQHSEELQKQTLGLYDEKAFMRSAEMRHRIECFPLDQEHTSLKADFFAMRQKVKQEAKELHLSCLIKHRWFMSTLAKFREQLKKLSYTNIPDCCSKMILATKDVLLMEFPYTKQAFYGILESVVRAKEDHANAAVHHISSRLRVGAGISAEEFLGYLEDRNIAPGLELVNQVRAESRAGAGAGAADPGKFLQMSTLIAMQRKTLMRGLSMKGSSSSNLSAAPTPASPSAVSVTISTPASVSPVLPVSPVAASAVAPTAGITSPDAVAGPAEPTVPAVDEALNPAVVVATV